MVAHRNRGRCRGARRNQRVTVNSVRKAIKQYPRDAGASVHNIHRLVNKFGRNRRKRSISKVRRAIQRAIANGTVRPTGKGAKGWTGFRSLNRRRQTRRYTKGPQRHPRRGRPPRQGGVRSLGNHRCRSTRRPGVRGRSRMKNVRRGTASRGRSRGRPAKASGVSDEEETVSLLSTCAIQ